MRKKIKIGIVSYLNALPFVCGLQHTNWEDTDFEIEPVFAYPSRCSELFLNQEVDIALIPTGALVRFPNYKIITNYVIGAEKEVDSVLLLSDVPLENIETILLDYQSNTSVKLIQILAEKYWHIMPKMIAATPHFEDSIEGTTAGLVIGDRAFKYQSKHSYVYDLSAEWYAFTNLPFVFAVWLAHENVPTQFIDLLNAAFAYGTTHIDKCIATSQNHLLSTEQTVEYLTKKIAYRLDADKRLAIEKFLDLSKLL